MPRKKSAPTRMLIGYWHSEAAPLYSHPQPLVDPAWEAARRHQLVAYLESGHAFRAGGGSSYCRFGCTQEFLLSVYGPAEGEYLEMKHSHLVTTDVRGRSAFHPVRCVTETRVDDESGYYTRVLGPMANGHLDLCDEVWCWPNGLAHYVESHAIRLPDEFVAHAAARRFQAAPPVPYVEVDDRFWRQWCETHAPFTYEPDCHACTSPYGHTSTPNPQQSKTAGKSATRRRSSRYNQV